jgi:hypothetical protein
VKLLAAEGQQKQKFLPFPAVSVNERVLLRDNSYDLADFVRRGYYIDIPFCCDDCNKEEVWNGTRQKWWYEVANGFTYSTAIRCRLCRRKERQRRDEARRVHLKGLEKKQQRNREGSK